MFMERQIERPNCRIFIESCMTENMSDVQHRLEANPGLVNQAAPREWHNYHIMR